MLNTAVFPSNQTVSVEHPHSEHAQLLKAASASEVTLEEFIQAAIGDLKSSHLCNSTHKMEPSRANRPAFAEKMGPALCKECGTEIPPADFVKDLVRDLPKGMGGNTTAFFPALRGTNSAS